MLRHLAYSTAIVDVRYKPPPMRFLPKGLEKANVLALLAPPIRRDRGTDFRHGGNPTMLPQEKG